MTRSLSSTVFHDPAWDQPQVYVAEPDIPEGMTCAAWRRTHRRAAERGLIAHVPSLRWHHLRKALS